MDYNELEATLRKRCKGRVDTLADMITYGYSNDVKDLGPQEIVYKTGGEDEGSNWIRIVHFIQFELYMQIAGYYTSYEGVEFQDNWEDHVSQVVPEEYTATRYVTKY